ncbi:MAG: formylglycine-generating enzyme family protein [Desulfobacterales bacterium]|nr:formylglycine-generating enzyme family protein [Desulfobacterales bacterium]
MSSISRLILIGLEGSTPIELGLPKLSTVSSTTKVVTEVFKPYLSSSDNIFAVHDFSELKELPQVSGLSIIYIVGHGWLNEDGNYTTSIIENSKSKIISGGELIKLITPILEGAYEFILIADTCVSAALRHSIADIAHNNFVVIFSSGEDENALEFSKDRVTRFTLALKQSFYDYKKSIELDIIRVVLRITDIINSPNLLISQTVDYWSKGPSIKLDKLTQYTKNKKEVTYTYLYIRAILITIGIIIAILSASVGLYYRNHIFLHIETQNLSSILINSKVSVHSQNPDENLSELIREYEFNPDIGIKLRLPVGNLIIKIEGKYKDGRERKIQYHIVKEANFSPQYKMVKFSLPDKSEILSHPDMVYIPYTEWLHGPDKRKEVNLKSFWIDIKPVTIAEYFPFAIEENAKGNLLISVLLTAKRNERAIEAVGLNQLPDLVSDLKDVFNVINSENRPIIRQSPENNKSDNFEPTNLPCDNCPAPVTLEEAQLFCANRDMHVPSSKEWELAARGVDGRLYPWGNKFEKKRANVIGLPDKGEKLELKPSDNFKLGSSPFGVLDMVGNAGDWVIKEDGYSELFGGGVYNFDPESCLSYSLMPNTGEALPYWEITVRCVK